MQFKIINHTPQKSASNVMCVYYVIDIGILRILHQNHLDLSANEFRKCFVLVAGNPFYDLITIIK